MLVTQAGGRPPDDRDGTWPWGLHGQRGMGPFNGRLGDRTPRTCCLLGKEHASPCSMKSLGLTMRQTKKAAFSWKNIYMFTDVLLTIIIYGKF